MSEMQQLPAPLPPPQQQARGAVLGFMTTMPGILTAIAAVVTAAGSIYLGAHQGSPSAAAAPAGSNLTSSVSSSTPPSPVPSVDPQSLRLSADNLGEVDLAQSLIEQCGAGDDIACITILDTLSRECSDGVGLSCDVLYEISPSGSAYEAYGATCGGRWESYDYADMCSQQ